MSDLTERHITILRALVQRARATNSDVGMDASVLAALLDERDALRSAHEAQQNKINDQVKVIENLQDTILDMIEVSNDRDDLRAALLRLADAVRTELEGRSELAGYDKRVSAVWDAEQAAREVLGG